MALIQWKQISPHFSGSGNLTGSLNVSGSLTLNGFSVALEAAEGAYAVVNGGNNFTGSQNILGNLNVVGDITANQFHTQLTSASIIYESGSSLFGNTFDDTHQFTGSVLITGSLNTTGPFTLVGDQTSTGSYKLELNGVDKYFSVNINGVSQVKVNEEGVLQLASKDTAPTAVTGGLFYSSSNEYYLGFIQ